jgi:hypothetical protein
VPTFNSPSISIFEKLAKEPDRFENLFLQGEAINEKVCFKTLDVILLEANPKPEPVGGGFNEQVYRA